MSKDFPASVVLENIERCYVFCIKTQDGYELTWQVHRTYDEQLASYLVIGKYADYHKLLDHYIQLETMIEHMPCNVYWMDNDLTHIGCNQNVLDMLNLSKEKYVGSTYEELSQWARWPEGLATSFKSDDIEVMRSGNPKLNVEEPLFNDAEGKPLYLLTSRVPLCDVAGKIVGVAGISTDITQQKEALHAAESARQRQADFIANMSHDIKTPITGMLGLLQSINQMTDDTEIKRLVKMFATTTTSLLSLLDDSIDAIKIRTGQLKLSLSPFNLYELVNKNIRLIQPSAENKNIRVNFDYDVNLPHCFVGDKNFINRILLNLIGNAIKFTSEGSVLISVHQLTVIDRKYTCQISVKDTGIGIPLEKQEVIFAEFTRLEPTYKSEYEGHGIGLYTVKNFVNQMGGTIDVESEVGKGSEFKVVLTLDLASDQTISDQVTDFLAISHSNKQQVEQRGRFLVVEDNKLASGMVKGTLSHLGIQADIVETGCDALALIKQVQYDAVLMDIGLPDMDGFEVTQMIRQLADPKKSQIKVIGLSGHADKTHRHLCLKAGMNDMISKPLSAAVAKEVVDACVGQ